MKRRTRILVSILSILFSLGLSFAQDGNGARQINLAQTYLAEDNYLKAEDLLTKGLEMVEGKNPYWEAIAHYYLAIVSQKKNKYPDEQEIKQHLQIAKQLLSHEREGLDQYTRLVNLKLRELQPETEIYGGIELNRGMVKFSVVSATMNQEEGILEYEIEEDKIRKTSTGNPYKSNELIKVVRKFYRELTENNGLDTSKIFIVINQGANDAKDQDAWEKEIAGIKRRLRTQVSNPNLKIFTVSSREMSEQITETTVLTKGEISSVTIEIHREDIKGGYFIEGERFEAMEIPIGIFSFTQLAEERGVADEIQAFCELCKDLNKDKVERKLGAWFDRHPTAKKGKEVYITGDVIWAFLTYMYPEQYEDKYKTCSIKDIQKFKELAINQFDELQSPNLSSITNSEIKEKVVRDVKNLNEEFSRKEIIAGAYLIEKILEEYKKVSGKKYFTFVREGEIGWMKKYIMEDFKDK